MMLGVKASDYARCDHTGEEEDRSADLDPPRPSRPLCRIGELGVEEGGVLVFVGEEVRVGAVSGVGGGIVGVVVELRVSRGGGKGDRPLGGVEGGLRRLKEVSLRRQRTERKKQTNLRVVRTGGSRVV